MNDSLVQGTSLPIYFGTKVSEVRYGSDYPIPSVWPFDHVLTVLSVGVPGAEVELKRQWLPKSAIGLGSAIQDYAYFDTSGFDGPLSVMVFADADGHVPEVDETNNVIKKTITITTPDLPELWMDAATIHVDPPLVAPGATYTVHGIMRNTGKRSATGIVVTLATASVTVPALAPGDSTDVPVTLTAGGAGTYSYQYLIDPSALIAEGSRANNWAPVTVYVAGSDLEIASVSVDPDPVVGGGTEFVTVTYRNIGTTTASGSVTASVLQGTTTLATSGAGTYPPPGQSSSVTVPVSTAGMLGDTSLVVRLSFTTTLPGHVVEKPLVLHVRNPDFAVTPRAIQVERYPVEQSQDVRATIVVNNNGSAAGTTSVRLYRGYREQGDLVASGTLTIAAGSSATFQSGWFPLTSVAAEVLTAVVDEENAVLEPNENDNIAVRDLLKAPGELIVAFDETKLNFYTVSTNPPYQDSSGVDTAGGYADWARDLEARGFTIRTINPGNGGLSSRTLRGVDVLVIQPSSDFGHPQLSLYRSDEIAAMKQYLGQGGALLFIGEWGDTKWRGIYGDFDVAWMPAQDAFLREIGWTSAHTRVGDPTKPDMWSDPDTFFSRANGQILDHPAMKGVALVHSSWVGAFAALPADASPMIVMGNGQQAQLADWSYVPASYVVAAGGSYGAGRVAAILDSNVFDSKYVGPHSPGYYLADNRRFALQLVDWLAGGSPRDAYPDLLVSAVDGPSVVTGGDLVQYAVTVTNVGDTIQATGVTVRFYDGDRATGRVIGEVRVGALGVDESERASVAWDSSHHEGDHVITVVVDPDDEVREFDENNNSASMKVHVRDAFDLRVDPSDITVTPGQPVLVSVRVHNTGYRDAGAGGRLDVAFLRDGSTFTPGQSMELPMIPARSGMTFTFQWRGEFPQFAFAVNATATWTPAVGYDADHTNDGAMRDVTPPTLAVQAPVAGTQWGGHKYVRWTATSFTRPKLTCSVSIAPAGGAFTGLPGMTCDKVEVDTTQYADGAYVVRVLADDGLQASTQDVPISIANASAAVRAFGAAPGSSAVALSPPSGSTSIRIPVGARVLTATAVMAPVPAAYTTISATPVYDSGGAAVVRLRGAIHVFYTKYTGGLWTQASYDDGATWGRRCRSERARPSRILSRPRG
jgi:subtilase family serine protease